MSVGQMKMAQEFHKRIFTAGIFFKDIGYLLIHIPQIIAASHDEKIGKAFQEKIMTVVTAINGCTYCTWFHAKVAVDSGISKEELKNLLSLQFNADAADYEIPALLYAQHFAETNRNPSSEMTKKLYSFYGEKAASHIILFIRMIFFGNLTGNTWDAVMSRLKEHPVKDSSIFFEVFFFLCTFLFMLPAMVVVKRD